MNTPITISPKGLPPTFKRAALIWWAWLWRSVLLGLGGSIFLSLVLNIAGILNRDDSTSRIIITALAILVSVPLGIWAFQMVLEKKFREFTIELVPRSPVVREEVENASEANSTDDHS